MIRKDINTGLYWTIIEHRVICRNTLNDELGNHKEVLSIASFAEIHGCIRLQQKLTLMKLMEADPLLDVFLRIEEIYVIIPAIFSPEVDDYCP